MELEICPTCKGEGCTREDIGGHQSDYIYPTCTKCGGTGKVYALKYNFTIRFPSTRDKNELYKIDSTIHDCIRKNNPDWR